MEGPIKSYVLTLLGTHHIRMTPADIAHALHQQFPLVQRPTLRKTLKKMVTEGSLTYTNHFSTTHLEVNFNRPVKVTPRIFLSPANCTPMTDGSSIIIKLNDGTAFGGGDHPTTRLCLQGLDYALDQEKHLWCLSDMRALDIGTGSGVLALAAVGLGVGSAKGIDIDSTACNEAKINVALNGMHHRITIANEILTTDSGQPYDLILANLRPPTLKQLFSVMKELSRPRAIWVLSGFRNEEAKSVTALLPLKETNVMWRSEECGWAAMVVALTAKQAAPTAHPALLGAV
jgi:ribosomal protein L11 methyltransferase